MNFCSLALLYLNMRNHIGDVMVNELASSAVDRGFEPKPGQTKVNKCVFAASQLST